MMKTLFLQPPSFDGFDGGAGSRYQARREIRSFWYPTWLPSRPRWSRAASSSTRRRRGSSSSRSCRSPRITSSSSSTPRPPSFASDAKVAAALKERNPKLKIGFVGRQGRGSSRPRAFKGAPAIDFVARNEFDFTIKEIAEGRPFDKVDGISYRDVAGSVTHNLDRATLEDMDQLPFVTEVYKRDLKIEDYFIGYLKHPYISIYTGRGCKYALHLLPVAARRWAGIAIARAARPQHVAEEIAPLQKNFPQVQGVLLRRRHLHRRPAARRGDCPASSAKMGVTWSCNAKANVPRATLKGAEGQWSAPCFSSAMNPAISRSCTTSRRAC